MGITNLGQITGAVDKVLTDRRKEEIGYYEDARRMDAPPEYIDLVFEGWNEETTRRLVACVHSFGVPFNQFKKELRERCDSRWLHVHGMDEVFMSSDWRTI